MGNVATPGCYQRQTTEPCSLLLYYDYYGVTTIVRLLASHRGTFHDDSRETVFCRRMVGSAERRRARMDADASPARYFCSTQISV